MAATWRKRWLPSLPLSVTVFCFWLLMNDGDHSHLVQFVQQVVDAGLSDLAHVAWSNHLAELQTAMSEEQFERYQHRSAA